MNPPDFIRRLPKAELHLHLEGALPWGVIREYVDEAPETPEWWASDFRYTDFEQFNDAMRPGMFSVLKTVDRYHMVAQHIFRALVAQNVRCVEISFSPAHVLRQHLSVDDVAAAVKHAAPDGLAVAVFCGLDRIKPHLLEDDLVRAVFGAPTVDGIDLHGKELPLTAPPFATIFDHARQHGFRLKAHAGELAGAPSIWDALEHLKVNRIEHGTRAVEDEALVDFLVEHDITLDMCPTSNLKLRVVDDPDAHPIRTLFQRGVRVTVNTDDPTFFGCSLTDELRLLIDRFGFTLAELAEVQKNAFRASHIGDGQRAAIFAEIDTLANEASRV